MRLIRRFYASKRFLGDQIDFGVLVIQEQGGKYQEHVARLVLEPHVEGDEITEPTMRLGKPEAQEIMDALWYTGIRPTSGEGNTGQLGATERHLEDMRRLVFKNESQ